MIRRLAIVAIVVGLAGALWYLRDPAWLIDQTTGLRAPERAADGTGTRWTGGHASFFVPAAIRALRLRVATTFDPREPGGDRPMLVTFTIDDERAGRVLLMNADWQEVMLTLPSQGNRRFRRVDLRTSITRDGNHGVRVGELKSTTDGQDWRPCCFSLR